MKQRWSDVVKYGLLVLFLLLAAWLLLALPEDWFSTRARNFVGEIGSALVGAAISAGTAAVIVFYALSVRRRVRRQARQYTAVRHESQRARSLQLGALRIPNIVVVAAMTKEQGQERVRFEFAPLQDAAPRQPAGWETLKAERLEVMKREAAINSRLFTDELAVDVVSAGISTGRRQNPDGIVRYSLVPRATSYHLWAATSGSLDRSLSPLEAAALSGEGDSLRQRWKLNPSRLEDVSSLPSPAKVGCGVVVITSDNMMVLGLRGRTFVAGGDNQGSRTTAAVHFVAEGMIPEDVDMSGRINPLETAKRGLMEELALGDTGVGTNNVKELVPTGMFFDTERWQPCFAYLARISSTFDELSTIILSARDFWESDQVVPIPFDPFTPETRSLMLDTHEQFHFASNHAQALAYFALLHEFGLSDMEDAMVKSRRLLR